MHFGSIVAATGSWLDARVADGQWKLRIDDLDGPRVVKGSVDSIFRILESCGLVWDGDPVLQSLRFERYQSVLNDLIEQGLTYRCRCSRKDWQNHTVYPGTCRLLENEQGRAIRFKPSLNQFQWLDLEQGIIEVNVGTDIGDFMLKNAHGIFSYQLANSIDDVDMGVTDVVRGADLMTVTAAHLLIQQAIGGHSIRYRHLPLALTSAGEKLSKATNAPEVEAKDASHTLQRAFLHLGLGTIELDASIHMLDEALSKWPHRKKL